MDGWIKLHRSIRDHWIWSDPVKLRWWIDIILTVNHAATKVNIGYQLYDCGRGQSIQSIGSWAKRWGVSKDTARNFLTLLEKDGMILHESLGKTTRLTVCNYDLYQDDLHDSPPMSLQESHRSPTDEPPIAHTNNKDKKEKNDKNDKKNTRGAGINSWDLSYMDEAIKPVFFEWLEYKKASFKFSYKTERSLEAAYNELVKLSGGDPNTARQIINNSMAKGWKGMFPLDSSQIPPESHPVGSESGKGCNSTTTPGNEPQMLKKDYSERF